LQVLDQAAEAATVAHQLAAGFEEDGLAAVPQVHHPGRYHRVTPLHLTGEQVRIETRAGQHRGLGAPHRADGDDHGELRQPALVGVLGGDQAGARGGNRVVDLVALARRRWAFLVAQLAQEIPDQRGRGESAEGPHADDEYPEVAAFQLQHPAQQPGQHQPGEQAETSE
jgi:hypothetical protein